MDKQEWNEERDMPQLIAHIREAERRAKLRKEASGESRFCSLDPKVYVQQHNRRVAPIRRAEHQREAIAEYQRNLNKGSKGYVVPTLGDINIKV